MSSYFTLELDTTGPIIQINAPSYTSRDVTDVITISGNEKLSSYQDIYIMDSQSVRHDVTFAFDGDRIFSGNVSFSGYPVGVATIFAQLKDDVDNLSNLASSHISVVTSTYYSSFKLTMGEQSIALPMSIATNSPTFKEIEATKSITEQTRQAIINTPQTKFVIVSDTN